MKQFFYYHRFFFKYVQIKIYNILIDIWLNHDHNFNNNKKGGKKFHGFFIIINVLRVKILLRRRNFLVVIVLTISRKVYFIFLALNCSVVVQPTIPTKHKKSGLKLTWGHIFLESDAKKNLHSHIRTCWGEIPKKQSIFFY